MSALTKISFKLLGFLKAKTGGWVFLYGCPVLKNDVGYITERRMVCDDK
jgi:hypothetical protein